MFLFRQLTLRLCIRQPSWLGKVSLGQWRKSLGSRFLLLELSVIEVLRDCKSMKIKSADCTNPLPLPFPLLKCPCGLVIFIVSDSPQQNSGQKCQIPYICCKLNTKYELPKLQWLILLCLSQRYTECLRCVCNQSRLGLGLVLFYFFKYTENNRVFFPTRTIQGKLFYPVILLWDSKKIALVTRSTQGRLCHRQWSPGTKWCPAINKWGCLKTPTPCLVSLLDQSVLDVRDQNTTVPGIQGKIF